MMKLKYLFDQRELAHMLLENWHYDQESLDLFKYYRISSNATYPFKCDGELRFLRFSPVDEKNLYDLQAEHHFITYLHACDYPALHYVQSKHGNDIEQVETPWGSYNTSVFIGVPGKALGQIDYTPEIARIHGEYLGKLHKHASHYEGHDSLKKLRQSYVDVFNWIEIELKQHSQENAALKEANTLRNAFETFSQTPDVYGLIHYDFELDNVFFDATTSEMHVIDFDDSMYHWYMMDIDQALDSIESDVETEDMESIISAFLEGYESHFSINHDLFKHRLLFRRFANLYGYTRILRATSEKWQGEPEWMIQLRGKLTRSMVNCSRLFNASL